MDAHESLVEADEETRAVSVSQAAERLSLSYSGLRRLIKAGDLRTVSVGGRTLVRISDIRRFLDERTVCGCGFARKEVGA